MSQTTKVLRITSLSAIVLLVLLICCRTSASPTSQYEAEQVVMGWLASDTQPLGMHIGRYILDVQPFDDDDGQAVYYVVNLYPRGFVIVPADDLIEPIVCFTAADSYDASPENPLGALVSRDLSSRIETARTNHDQQTGISIFSVSETQRKWNHLINLAAKSSNTFSISSVSSLSDVRVPPLMQSKWSQENVCGQPCYNYYTPNNYYTGCVATAMAQIMRYHEYPTTEIGVHEFTIKVDDVLQTVSTIGGDGNGGPYSWANMVLIPDCSTIEEQRQAIGALCYDAGISIEMEYSDEGSSADILAIQDALTDTFKYDNTVTGYNDGDNIGEELIEMINPNLDTALPVILGIWYDESGHAVICDGYGYNASTLYHHLNMGWGGYDDVWYNLPNVDTQITYDSVIACVYNIFTSGTGEIISGRITDLHGTPISDATVVAYLRSSSYQAKTNSKGIYALVNVPSASTYTITVKKEGYLFEDQTIRTGTSRNNRNTTGNKWQADFVGVTFTDLDADGDVDSTDFAIFALSWLAGPEDGGWNPLCDLSIPTDDFVDVLDLAEFAKDWLAGTE